LSKMLNAGQPTFLSSQMILLIEFAQRSGSVYNGGTVCNKLARMFG